MITKFSTAHVKVQAKKIADAELTTWCDGTYIVIAAGEGLSGESLGSKLIANCTLPAFAKKSKLLGSVRDLEAKAALGIVDQTFVLISRQ